MDNTLEALEAAALKLAPGDRSHLAERLLASLDEDEEIEAAWDALAEEREAEVGPASAGVVPLDAAMARLEARFPG
jgi:transposase